MDQDGLRRVPGTAWVVWCTAGQVGLKAVVQPTVSRDIAERERD